MAKTAILSYDIQTVKGKAGGVATFSTQLARLLRAAGDEVTLILTRMEPFHVPVDPAPKAAYLAEGIQVKEIHLTMPGIMRWPQIPPLYLAEQITAHLADYDVLYFQDWVHTGFDFLRRRRYQTARSPVVVTVLHGASEWERTGNQRFAQLPNDLYLDYIERYSAEHSDLVVSPSRYMLDYVRAHGWSLADDITAALGLPFHPPFPSGSAAQPTAESYRKLIYFGRIETRKGFEMFVAALLDLARQRPDLPATLENVIFLGALTTSVDRDVDAAWASLRKAGYSIQHIGNQASDAALGTLAANAHDSLVVIPSLSDNFPYTVLETSLIPGIRLLAARTGGIPEIIGGADNPCLFEPYTRALTAALIDHLGGTAAAPPIPVPYDYTAANARYLALHQRALELVEAKKHIKPAATIPPAPQLLDVCITFYNKGAFLAQALEALAHQTVQAFTVYVWDDGSTDPDSIAIFDHLRDQYAARGWTFVRGENRWVDAARNAIAKMGSSPYLLFIDADDVPALNMVERYLTAILASGDDALTCSGCLFVGDQLPFELPGGKLTAPTMAHYVPLGASPIAGLIEPVVLGGPMSIMRRSAFEAVGGYREWRGVAHEDWELHARLMLAGCKTDVLPEMLQYYRQLSDGLSQTADNMFRAKQRVIDVYESALKQVGLGGAAWALYGIYNQLNELQLRHLDVQTSGRLAQVPFHQLPNNWHSLDNVNQRIPRPITRLRERLHLYFRDLYRNALPLETRLKLHAALMRLLKRGGSA